MKRKVLVTGATRGIGRAIAANLLRSGYEVVGTGRESSAERCRSDEDIKGIRWFDVDLSDRKSLALFIDQLEDEAPFYGLVNNAGVNRIKPYQDVSQDDYDFVHETNLRAPYLITQKLAHGMVEKGEGRVVNIGSVWSVVTKAQRSLYSSAKTGLVGMTRALAAELGERGVLVNLVSPGFVLTDMTRESLSDEQMEALTAQIPVKRMAQPEDIAEVVRFLISPENRYITGQNILADGGFSIV